MMKAKQQRSTQPPGRWRRFCGYLLYGVVSVVLALWLLFPRESVQRYLRNALNQAMPTLNWEVGTIRVKFPLVFTLRQVGAYSPGASIPSLDLRDVTLWPEWESLLREHTLCLGYAFSVGSGQVQGRLCRQEQKIFAMSGKIEGLQLASLPLLAQQFGRQIQGTFGATFAAKLPPSQIRKSTWRAQCLLEKGQVQLMRPVVGHKELPFSAVRMRVEYQESNLRIAEGKIFSPLGEGWFNGMVQGAAPLVSAQLKLRGGLHPQSLFFAGLERTPALSEIQEILEQEPLTFNLSGTVQTPAIHFESLAMQIYALDKE